MEEIRDKEIKVDRPAKTILQGEGGASCHIVIEVYTGRQVSKKTLSSGIQDVKKNHRSHSSLPPRASIR